MSFCSFCSLSSTLVHIQANSITETLTFLRPCSRFVLVLVSFRSLITRYLTCKSADDVRAMQDLIISEMETERDERRREKG